MKSATRTASLIVQALEVSIDIDSGRAEDTTESAAERAEIAARLEVSIELHAFLEKHGVATVLEAIQMAAEMAADAHDGPKDRTHARALRDVAQSLANAAKVCS